MVGGYGTVVVGLARSPSAAAPGSAAGSGAAGSGSVRREGVTGSAIALLVSGTVLGRLSYLGELDGATRTWENRSGQREDHPWQLDRLYAELAVSDALRLRAGRFLTPVGQWNEVHADPLTWTTERPLTTYRPFAKSVTGLMAAGTLELGTHDAGYAFFYAPVPTGTPGQETAFLRAGGGRVALELLPDLHVGVSGVAFRASWPYDADDDASELPGADSLEAQARPAPGPAAAPRADLQELDVARPGPAPDHSTRGLLGADLSWTPGRIELLAEATALSAAGTHPPERGAFAQLALPLAGPLFLVLRAERYSPIGLQALWIRTLGLALRPSRHLTFKLDRQTTDRASPHAPDGWYLSGSAMF